MSKSKIRMKTGLNFNEAKQAARNGDLVQYGDWPASKVMDCKDGIFRVMEGKAIILVVLDNEFADTVFSHMMTPEYIGVNWNIV